jgi:hypothetical protein
MSNDPLASYSKLQKGFSKDVLNENNRSLIGECVRAALMDLKNKNTIDLRSLVPQKEYFAFSGEKKFSRAVNKSLFLDDPKEWDDFSAALAKNQFGKFSVERITKIIYSAAISFCCYVDIHKEGDQKTPGTFFEYLIGHVFAWRLGVNPTTRLPVLNIDMETTLPTDFVFNLGKDKPKFHLPIKISTRERVIQVWAHQRVLDGVYGTGRFLGTPVILTETKTDQRKKEVIEICLPDQWRIYQMHIAQLKRIYYLDVPATYDKLNFVFPRLNVKSFGHFFFELDSLTG